MLPGFDNQTAPLTDNELAALPQVVSLLKQHFGRDNAITNIGIQAEFPELTDARVRKIINHIRNNNLVPCLIACSKGYYVAETEQEMKDFEDSLRGRAEAIMAVCESIKSQRVQRFGGAYQLSIF